MNGNGIIPLDFVEAVMHGYREQPWCKNVYLYSGAYYDKYGEKYMAIGVTHVRGDVDVLKIYEDRVSYMLHDEYREFKTGYMEDKVTVKDIKEYLPFFGSVVECLIEKYGGNDWERGSDIVFDSDDVKVIKEKGSGEFTELSRFNFDDRMGYAGAYNICLLLFFLVMFEERATCCGYNLVFILPLLIIRAIKDSGSTELMVNPSKFYDFVCGWMKDNVDLIERWEKDSHVDAEAQIVYYLGEKVLASALKGK